MLDTAPARRHIERLAGFVGTWQGTGSARFPTIETAEYREELRSSPRSSRSRSSRWRTTRSGPTRPSSGTRRARATPWRQPLTTHLPFYVASRFTRDPFAMQVLNVVEMTAAVAVVAFAAPWPLLYSALFAVGYFPFFEYGTISRHYSLPLLINGQLPPGPDIRFLACYHEDFVGQTFWIYRMPWTPRQARSKTRTSAGPTPSKAN